MGRVSKLPKRSSASERSVWCWGVDDVKDGGAGHAVPCKDSDGDIILFRDLTALFALILFEEFAVFDNDSETVLVIFCIKLPKRSSASGRSVWCWVWRVGVGSPGDSNLLWWGS
jgi:hypothetical protein